MTAILRLPASVRNAPGALSETFEIVMKIDRKINPADPMHVGILFQEIAQARGWLNVSISPARAKAHQAQFAYYFAVVLPIATHWFNRLQGPKTERTGWCDDEVDVWLKTHLRGIDVVNPTSGEVMDRIPPSKADWTVTEMYEFTDDVVALLNRFGEKVPPPDKQWREARRAQAA